MNEGELKSSYQDIISAIGDFFHPWAPSSATPIMLDDKPHLVTFHECLGQPMNFSAYPCI